MNLLTLKTNGIAKKRENGASKKSFRVHRVKPKGARLKRAFTLPILKTSFNNNEYFVDETPGASKLMTAGHSARQ